MNENELIQVPLWFFRFLGCPLDVLGDMDSDEAIIEIRSVERKCSSETCASCWPKTCEILKKYKSEEVIYAGFK